MNSKPSVFLSGAHSSRHAERFLQPLPAGRKLVETASDRDGEGRMEGGRERERERETNRQTDKQTMREGTDEVTEVKGDRIGGTKNGRKCFEEG